MRPPGKAPHLRARRFDIGSLMQHLASQRQHLIGTEAERARDASADINGFGAGEQGGELVRRPALPRKRLFERALVDGGGGNIDWNLGGLEKLAAAGAFRSENRFRADPDLRLLHSGAMPSGPRISRRRSNHFNRISIKKSPPLSPRANGMSRHYR